MRLTFLMVIAIACSCTSEMKSSLPEGMRIGLNDSAYYEYDSLGYLVKVKKISYSNADFDAWVNHDTLKLGDEFEARISVYKNSYKIFIQDTPGMDTIRSREENTVADSISYEFVVKPQKAGLTEFNAIIEWDTCQRRLHWNILVLDSVKSN
ncbi:MAG: hypothetical protein JNK18_12045 [Cyclobacteriaceae bacterium]|nr:hypothetical protein [Cyclobacteriaceae bacterium]